MTAPPPPPPPGGRRDNGLPSADWGALVDVDPRLAEGLLDRLAAAAVPAFVEPASATDPFSRASFPSRPLDRLWVDPARADDARAVVAAEVSDLAALLAESDPEASAHGLVLPVPRHAARRVLTPPPLPDPPGAPGAPGAPAAPPAAGPPADEPAPPAPEPVDEDELFRQIVAGFHTDPPADGPVSRWPVQEDADPPAARGPREPGAERPARPPRRRRDDEALPAWLEPEALDDPTLDTGGYVPPPPPPAPRVQPRTLGAVAALLLGLVLVFVPELLGQSSTPGTLLLGAACMVGGAGCLVWWVRDAPDDSGPGDGAVV